MITGLRPQTFQNLQLNAGAFLVNFDYTAYQNKDDLVEAVQAAIKSGKGVLGATRGGGTFECTPQVRSIEADGKRYEFVGSTIFDSFTVRMTGTLMEVSPENVARMLGGVDVMRAGGSTTLRIRTALGETDYIDRLCWFGDTSRGVVLIALHNALNTAGMTLTFTDQGEGTLPFEFHAHQSSAEEMEYAPCEIVFFDEEEANGGDAK